MSGFCVVADICQSPYTKGPLAARGATMWWLAAADLYRSALSGDQLILVVKRVRSRVQSQLRIGLSICWLPTYDGTFQGDLSAPPHIQKGCCGLARRTVCEHTLPQRFCVDTFWTRQHVIPALRKIRSELRLRRRVRSFFFLALSIGRVCFWQHMFFLPCIRGWYGAIERG